MVKEKIKRVVALSGVILIVLLLIATLVVALLSFPGSQKVFIALVACDILLPVFLWIYMTIYRLASKADDDMNKDVNN